ncbi:hypothetical protein [Cohnella rhizosphaerae]|uniref:Uncharacterized protein n=1 Tax=Cohnella rhizosphaerae TaxID=1457232 RepID=A0A9X4L1B4_9BACL|nr:hypothetical protein [Cohnella rhizosphaerae]MDG0814306.1 hypothetical protein [Cohnella rhizosphaerae]
MAGGDQYFPNVTYALQYWTGSAYADLAKGYTLGGQADLRLPDGHDL